MENKFQDIKKSVRGFINKDIFQDLQDLFTKDWPLMNLYTAGEDLFCLIALPGVHRDQFHIYVNYQSILIKGDVSLPIQGESKLVRKEFSMGAFERSLTLPKPVHQTPKHVSYANGLLILQLQQIKDKEVSEISISSEETNKD
ncbi:Hsp20/alpha crystallin family protein [Terrilactibacillus laevilacticus]|uniref:Hsp20/alpha crystallin family protein n=1 Tax=Terrilactibacillus laevilacticus TaxID=1380157 RepID=A0ABW5PMM8_9BACI|nr:Hsp20/alpha crystallin family protein [Terrilactibacillus laevilacticus]